jgi:hypothetical protein
MDASIQNLIHGKSDLHRHAVGLGITVGLHLGKLEEAIRDMNATNVNSKRFRDHVNEMKRHTKALLRAIDMLTVLYMDKLGREQD